MSDENTSLKSFDRPRASDTQYVNAARQNLQMVSTIIRYATESEISEIRKMLIELAKTSVDVEVAQRINSAAPLIFGSAIRKEPYSG